MKSAKSLILLATLTAAFTVPVAAGADDESTTVTKTGPGTYSETHVGPDGKYKVQQNGVKTESSYEGHGVQSKESSNGVQTKQVYQDENCQQKSVTNEVTGNSKTVAKGDCAQ
jgi:hypothetical protein